MKFKLATLAAALFFTLSLEALLPPLYEGSREIRAILSDKALGEKLSSGDVITQIIKTDDGYTLITNHRRVDVKVIYEQTGRIGPAQFHLQFGEPQ